MPDIKNRLNRLEAQIGTPGRLCADDLAALRLALINDLCLASVSRVGIMITRADLEAARGRAQTFEDHMLSSAVLWGASNP